MGKAKQGKSVKKSDNDDDLYRDIVVSTNTLIWRTDGEGRFSFLNPAWEKNCGYSVDEMLGRPFSEFQIPEAAEHYKNAFRNCLIGESVIGHETTCLSRDGDEINLVLNMTPLYDSDSVVTGTQGTAHDVTEQKRADKLLQYISAKDELTGLYNLHTFMSMTEQQIKNAEREKKEILVIYTGLDNVDLIKEIHGSEAVERLLIDTADILRKTFRETDILALTGGEEFVVSTLVHSQNTEDMILARLQGNLDQYNEDREGVLRLYLSVGTSFYNPEHPAPIEYVLSEADEKMHEDRENRES